MGRLRDLMHSYNEKWRDKSQVAESTMSVLLGSGDAGDWLTFAFSFILQLLGKKKQRDEERYHNNSSFKK